MLTGIPIAHSAESSQVQTIVGYVPSLLILVLLWVAFFSHGFSAHLDAVGIVHQAVQDAVRDGVRDGGISDLLVLAGDRQLGSEDGGASLVAILADLPDFASLGFIQRRHRPVIDHQNINAAESCQEVTQAAIRCS